MGLGWVVTGSRRMKAQTMTIHDVLSEGLVHSVYQPIVKIESGEIMAYEALARGPNDSDLESPARLFAEARRAGVLPALEYACRTAALRGALEAGLTKSIPLFVNIESEVVGEGDREDHEIWENARQQLRVVWEITERDMTHSPAELLKRIERIRGAGWSVALDDIGADPRSLAMLPFLSPDILKLDIQLVQNRTSQDEAKIVHAVDAEVERTGAQVVSEGIETEVQRLAGIAMGATLAQGWLFARPGPLVPPATPAVELRLGTREAISVERSPFEIVAAMRPVRRGPKRVLFEISRHLEQQAIALNVSPVVLSTFQDVRRFTAATQRLYEALADELPLTGGRFRRRLNGGTWAGGEGHQS
ncbi:MAG: EAL domain-containing protein [Actinobacteria bacterium]|nr:EAL domain-containing protein [Actinomycetota bacterium]